MTFDPDTENLDEMIRGAIQDDTITDSDRGTKVVVKKK
jgi:hypothetical protein